MSKFNTIADLIEAAAQQSHVANLHVGGIFSEDGSRHTAGQSVRYIPHVGYVNA